MFTFLFQMWGRKWASCSITSIQPAVISFKVYLNVILSYRHFIFYLADQNLACHANLRVAVPSNAHHKRGYLKQLQRNVFFVDAFVHRGPVENKMHVACSWCLG